MGQLSALFLFCCSGVSDSANPWTTAFHSSLSFTISQSLLILMSIESMMPSNHLIFCHHLLLLPLIFPSIRVFSNDSALLAYLDILESRRVKYRTERIFGIYTQWNITQPWNKAFESVLMRWMNLEPIIQSEVSQKEKDKYHMLMYMEYRKMVLKNLFTGQQWRNRHRE